jgi:Fic family protein
MYVPDTLADRTFILDGETAADIADAERAITELNNHTSALSNTEALARLMLRAEALSSSRIEGLVIGARRILKAEVGETTHDKTAQEVLNNITAMDNALNLALRHEVSLESIKAIHASLLANTSLEKYAGQIRTVQNWIGGNYYNPCGAAYVPPAANLIPALLDDLVRFCNEDRLSPLAQAAVAHAQFETIHPFVDGNGRTGRALIHLVLRRRGLCPQVVPPLSLVLATMRENYLRELTNFRHEGAADGPQAIRGLDSWLTFFAACSLRACSDSQGFEDSIIALKQEWLDRLAPEMTTATTVQIIDAMIGRPLFTSRLMQEATGRSAPSVNTAIDNLLAAGIVRQTNAGRRNRVFEAVGILDLFTGFERRLASPEDDTAISKPARSVPHRPE